MAHVFVDEEEGFEVRAHKGRVDQPRRPGELLAQLPRLAAELKVAWQARHVNQCGMSTGGGQPSMGSSNSSFEVEIDGRAGCLRVGASHNQARGK